VTPSEGDPRRRAKGGHFKKNLPCTFLLGGVHEEARFESFRETLGRKNLPGQASRNAAGPGLQGEGEAAAWVQIRKRVERKTSGVAKNVHPFHAGQREFNYELPGRLAGEALRKKGKDRRGG